MLDYNFQIHVGKGALILGDQFYGVRKLKLSRLDIVTLKKESIVEPGELVYS